jgi:hypothetical protein
MCLMGCLPEASRNLLVPCVAESSFGKGDLLLPEGEVAQHISIIKIGAVSAGAGARANCCTGRSPAPARSRSWPACCVSRRRCATSNC